MQIVTHGLDRLSLKQEPLIIMNSRLIPYPPFLSLQVEGDDDEHNQILLNPAHLLVCRYGLNKSMATKFADWMARRDGGQEVVRGFAVNGVLLYSMVPEKDKGWIGDLTDDPIKQSK